MSITNKIAQYREYKTGVKHCTFNPEGPGAVRIHLIPPRFRLFGNPRYIVILNGYYLLPLNYSWAVMLSAFMSEINKFDGKPINAALRAQIEKRTIAETLKVYPLTESKMVADDLAEMLRVLFAVAKGENAGVEIEKLSIRSYAANMSAPHRMDLMVSAMTDEQGAWKCNQKCLFCYAAGQTYGKTKELSTEEWKRAIDKLRSAGVPMLTFTGGEPTQRDDLAELIDYSRWFVTRLNTNGVNLTEALCEKLKGASLDSVQITLYSSDEKIHNALTGSEHFADTVSGIKTAIGIGLDVSVNTPICKENCDYVKTLEFLHSLGVRYVTCSGLICTGTASINHEKYDLQSEELYKAVSAAAEYTAKVGMEMNFTSPGLIDKQRIEELSLAVPSCGAALSNMAIAPDGTVVPCQSWLNGKCALGNVLTTPFEEIWNGDLCKKLREMSDADALCCPFRTGKFGE